MHRYAKLFLWIAGYLIVAFGIGQTMQGNVDGWYQTLNKPSFNPPNWIFPIMWSILYVLIATAGWKLWDIGASHKLKGVYILYTLMNWAWTPIFFGAQQMFMGLLWIVALNLVAALFIVVANRQVRLAALLMIPPFLWTLFASFLNYSIWMLNS